VRVIPCLDVAGGRVVKGRQFASLREAGDPVDLARRYNDQGADEIAFLDVEASPAGRRTVLSAVEAVARQVFVPLTVGGGIRSVSDMRDALQAGADKICVGTAALSSPEIISQGASHFGSQCIVLSIDARRAGSGWRAFSHGGRRDADRDAVEWAREGERIGAGEILLNSIDCDGCRNGYDLELIRSVSAAVSIPVIASGGAGSAEQVRAAIEAGRADAVLLASLLHDGSCTIGELKSYLKERGVSVR